MAFVQVIDFKSSKPEEVKRVHEEWEERTSGKRTARRVLSARYRDEPDRWCELVFFDSYDSAMQNSDLPETKEYAEKLREVIDGEPSYWNLDVDEDRAL